MPGPVLHAGAAATCPHGGPLNIVAASPRVMVNNMPAALLNDQGLVAGCTFAPGGKPQPCVTTRWIVGTTRVTSNGVPLLINPTVALCQSAEQLPGGPPVIMGAQTRVIAT
ncbi:hypothetical protein BTH42_32120 [Burkholderia sp. SRS-W-2-2016]|uniref:hypothetical protein n=1 Tax=Burkholderia sp. SRS-W-2-2016 TaxID=1926878 RepID=UPI00094B6799|nr:hypothetical protein [Burkholderia sp. SRS-W-2-2016]OLL27492.1 hypothetical protein BTH42_32120 [Burkholderia sp. SRS-W-2-2016]